MASSTLVRDALFRVSTQLQDISPQFVRWTQRELVAFGNDAAKAIAKFLPHSCARVDAIKLSAGTKQSIEFLPALRVKPGDGTAAADVYGHYLQTLTRNMGANGTTPGRAIRIVDREIMDVNTPDWHASSSTPVTAYSFDPRFPKVFYVYPGVPVGVDWWVEASYLANPVEIPFANDYTFTGTDNTLMPIDDKYVDDWVHYVLARAYLKDAEYAGNGNLAQVHTSMFTSSINSQVSALTGVNPNLQSLPLNPNVPAGAAARG